MIVGSNVRPFSGLSDGRFVIVYDYGTGGASGGTVAAQIFKPNGDADTECSNCAALSTGQNYASVTALSNGGFAVTWKDDRTGTIWWRVFDFKGDAALPEQQISTSKVVNQFGSMAALANGGFVAAYQTEQQEVRYRVIPGISTRATIEYKANLSPPDQWSCALPSVAALNTGNFVITWIDSAGGVKGRIFDPNGVPITTTEFHLTPIGTTGHEQSAVTGLSLAAPNQGDFVVVFISDIGISGQEFGALGNPMWGSPFTVCSATHGCKELSVANLFSGRFVVTWVGYETDGAGNIEACVFSSGQHWLEDYLKRQMDKIMAHLPTGVPGWPPKEPPRPHI